MKNSTKKILKEILKNRSFFKISDYFQNKTKISSFPKEKKEEKTPDSWIKINYKSYPRLKQIKLPDPKKLEMDLQKSIVNRRSRREFSKSPIEIEKISSLLQYSAGINYTSEKDKNYFLRAYPSGGARFPIETYLVVNNIDSLKKGLYHFNVKNNSLENLLNGDLSKKIANMCNQDFIKKSGVIFLLTGVFDRTRIKYKDRGLRYIYMECGHICQNIYLISEALGLSCCAIGGFVDNKVDKLLDIQSSSEKILYLIAVGNRKYENK